jgi:hypothetical protein
MTDLGDQPTPEVEPAEPPPGGVDAVEDQLYAVDPVVPDFASALNPHVAVPETVAEGEDTDQGASSDGASEPEKESQA